MILPNVPNVSFADSVSTESAIKFINTIKDPTARFRNLDVRKSGDLWIFNDGEWNSAWPPRNINSADLMINTMTFGVDSVGDVDNSSVYIRGVLISKSAHIKLPTTRGDYFRLILVSVNPTHIVQRNITLFINCTIPASYSQTKAPIMIDCDVKDYNSEHIHINTKTQKAHVVNIHGIGVDVDIEDEYMNIIDRHSDNLTGNMKMDNTSTAVSYDAIFQVTKKTHRPCSPIVREVVQFS